jgi:hypothetical protein
VKLGYLAINTLPPNSSSLSGIHMIQVYACKSKRPYGHDRQGITIHTVKGMSVIFMINAFRFSPKIETYGEENPSNLSFTNSYCKYAPGSIKELYSQIPLNEKIQKLKTRTPSLGCHSLFKLYVFKFIVNDVSVTVIRRAD